MQTNGPVAITTAPERSQPSIPDWVNHTEEIHGSYHLEVERDSTTVEQIDMDRQEYIELKRHLAKMRGHDVPAEPEAVQHEADAETESTDASQQLALDLVERITRPLRDACDLVWDSLWDTEQFCKYSNLRRVELQADLYLLNDIVTDWESGTWVKDFPRETNLVAAIKGVLNV